MQRHAHDAQKLAALEAELASAKHQIEQLTEAATQQQLETEAKISALNQHLEDATGQLGFAQNELSACLLSCRTKILACQGCCLQGAPSAHSAAGFTCSTGLRDEPRLCFFFAPLGRYTKFAAS